MTEKRLQFFSVVEKGENPVFLQIWMTPEEFHELPLERQVEHIERTSEALWITHQQVAINQWDRNASAFLQKAWDLIRNQATDARRFDTMPLLMVIEQLVEESNLHLAMVLASADPKDPTL